MITNLVELSLGEIIIAYGRHYRPTHILLAKLTFVTCYSLAVDITESLRKDGSKYRADCGQTYNY